MTSDRQNGPMRTDPEFGQKLEALMKRHGVKLITLARLCGLERSSPVYGWIKTNRISKDNLARVAAYFGFTSDTLYGRGLDDVLAMDDAMPADLKLRRAPEAAAPLPDLHPLALDAALMLNALPSVESIREAHGRLWAIVQELKRPGR
jgi:transcriptional regulator with XRE-family HTH domain